MSIDTIRTSSFSSFSSVQKLIRVRFVARRCLSAPQRPIFFSPSSHSQLLLESAATAFPHPAARSMPFDPAAVLQCFVHAPSRLSVVLLLVRRTRLRGREAAGRHHHGVLRHHPGRRHNTVMLRTATGISECLLSGVQFIVGKL